MNLWPTVAHPLILRWVSMREVSDACFLQSPHDLIRLAKIISLRGHRTAWHGVQTLTTCM
jgi:hypothetical protein